MYRQRGEEYWPQSAVAGLVVEYRHHDDELPSGG